MDLYLSALNVYLTHKTQIRQQLAEEMEVDVKTIKIIINALFCGARIGLNPDFAISQLLNNDAARIEYLKQNNFINELRGDIKTCWDYITPTMYRTSIIDKNNKSRLLPINSKQKWARYFDLERTILNSVVNYLTSHQYHYFLEHDGWACDHLILVNDLSDYVFEQTGYRVVFEQEQSLSDVCE